jgi:hypothetical protein
MAKPHLLLVCSLILNTAIAIGCANGYNPLSDQVALYREEAEELRAAAHYYEGEAQRSLQEGGQDSERTQRYRDFAEQASVQAEEADRYADEYLGQSR